jgi:hypothetical protein
MLSADAARRGGAVMSKRMHKQTHGNPMERKKLPLKKLRRPKDSVVLDYQTVRKDMKLGDILLFRGRGWLSRLICRVTHGKYSHSALLMPEWHDRLLVMQAEVLGVEIAPASHAVARYKGRVDWWELATEAYQQLDREKFLDALLEPVGRPYDFVGVIGLGLRRLFHMKKPIRTHRANTYFCSDYVAEVLEKGGIDMGHLQAANVAPKDFAASGLFVYKGTLRLDETEVRVLHPVLKQTVETPAVQVQQSVG